MLQTNEQTFKSDSSTPLFMFWISSWNTAITKPSIIINNKLSHKRRQPSLHELLTDISFSPESTSDPKLNGDQACQNKTTWQSTIPTITKSEQKHASKHLNNYLVNDIQLMFLIRYINPRIPLYFQEHEAAYKQTNWSINETRRFSSSILPDVVVSKGGNLLLRAPTLFRISVSGTSLGTFCYKSRKIPRSKASNFWRYKATKILTWWEGFHVRVQVKQHEQLPGIANLRVQFNGSRLSEDNGKRQTKKSIEITNDLRWRRDCP